MTPANNKTMTILSLLIALLAFLTYGCAGPSENAALKTAQNSYMQAKADPNVQNHASVPLYEAGKMLSQAKNAESDIEKSHLAYMAQKQTEIAVAMARQKTAEIERQQLTGNADKILLQQASSKAEAAEEELAALKAKKTDRGLVMTLGDVLFTTGNANLLPGAQRTLDKLAAYLKKNPEKKVSIEGHTDSRGSEDFNMMLSKRRADSVRSALIDRGISSDRITAKGLGERYPIAGNDTAAGRQQNRRVEIIISSAE